MKSMRVFTVLVVVVCLAGNVSAALVAHYEFEGNANDSAGSNHGTEIGNPTYGPGVFGQAINLDGDGDYVDCGNDPAFNITGEITVAAWVNITSLPTEWIGIVTKGNSAWRISNAGTETRFHFAVCGGPPWIFVNGETLAGFDEWHHVCGTYDGSVLRIYLDGSEDGSTAYADGITTNSFRVLIGANEERTDRVWDGLIDDVRIYSHALSQEDIQLLIEPEEPPEPPADVNGFTYQGRLMDNNAAADGLYDFEFKLYDAADAGTHQGATITIEKLDVIDGYFTVELDFGDGVFNGDPRWLQISVRPGGSAGGFTALGPRQELTPVPYAFYALAPGGGTDGGTGGIGGSGTTNYIPRFSSSSSIGNSAVYQSGGNIGIGTTSPDARLDVNGQVKISGGSPAAGKVLTSDASGLATWQTPTGGGGPDGDWAVSGNDMYAMPSGNVGVGTTSPGAKLEVNGQVKIAGGSPGAGKVLTSDAGGLATWQSPTGGGGGDNLGDHTATQNIKLSGHWLSSDGDDEGIYVAENGTVGIGGFPITVSGVRLDVAGEIYADGMASEGTITGWSDSGYGLQGSSPYGHGVHGWTISGYAGYFDGKGYFSEEVNIDTTWAALRVSGDQAIWYDGTTFSWGYGGSANCFYDPVAIGTSAPGSYTLAVNGSAAKTGGGSWDNFSDARLKEINDDYEHGLSEITGLNPVKYNYTRDNDLELPTEEQYVGVVAQEVQSVIPEAVKENSDGYLMVNNDPIIWAMVNAIKELKSENDALKQRLEALESRIQDDYPAAMKEAYDAIQ
ncbi:MAG: tail fiber domain-containing protein [Phycisphaerales bacterium]|nr:MAG: tail fiber domain-containing protein [Phycisphaerales bacterium]